MTIYNSITELVGKTPVIKLNSIVPEGSADVYVKLEAFNPGSSVKDRIAPVSYTHLDVYKRQTLGGWLQKVTSPTSGVTNSRGVTGGVYKARERIHLSLIHIFANL